MKAFFSFERRTNNDFFEPSNINIIQQDNALISVNKQEKHKSSFYETPNEWCFILGTVYNLTEKNVKVKYPAKMIVEKFSGAIQEFLLTMDGSFIIIYYDKKRNEYIICRDLIGLQHAFYSTTSEGFSLATEISDVLKFRKSVGTKLNVFSLDLYFTFQYLPQPYTMFSQINQLPNNGMIRVNTNGVTTSIFKKPFYEMLTSHKTSNNDLKTILVTSMNRQTKDAGKIGAFLSGGIDTSTNIGILAGVLGIKPIVFTAGFREANYDETPYAKTMARRYNLEHHIFTIKPNIIEKLPEVAALYNNPIADRAILPEYLICTIAKRMGITTMVSGEGGDEVLGYPRNIPEDAAFTSEEKPNKQLASYYYSLSSLMQKPLRKNLLSFSSKGEYLELLYRTYGNIHDFEKIYYGQWQTWMIDNVYVKDIQLFNCKNMSFVSPFMDIALMKHCVSLSVEDKLALLRNKTYLKRSLNKLLPNKIRNKQKHKFHVPINDWLKKEYYALCHETLMANDSLTQQFINKKYVEKMLSEHKKGIIDYNRPLWGLLFLEFWYKSKKTYI